MRSKAKPARRLVISLLAIAGAALILFFFHRYHYPHGLRSGKLTSFMGVLTHYAMDHGGRYPEGGATPLGSLQKLYPQYASRELAGMSGSESAAEKCLREGKTIETNISSWVYFPGFSTNDDPRIALIWEREAGIFVNGGRAEGHAVGFVGGGYDQVPPKDWPQFLKLQEALRAKVLKPEPPVQGPTSSGEGAADLGPVSSRLERLGSDLRPILAKGSVTNMIQLRVEYARLFPNRSPLFSRRSLRTVERDAYVLPERKYSWLREWSQNDSGSTPLFWSLFQSTGLVVYMDLNGTERVCSTQEFHELSENLANRIAHSVEAFSAADMTNKPTPTDFGVHGK